ncbi:hypothetical protein SAMN05421788_1011207 [Filimonas lacunae]|uniref:Uncharacterized protein n=1 Tax=Filimonas lacunae TaxID=477680 RepID=A0A173MQ58_9BACT|nr:hypothetical protein [Filimonas lacunae]BAV09774.1 hypothetical protein FLA_5827 [Filimonas lacunae]SIS78793.1 hypothetical protein SAMN05421788_1011207 [Filimonas lacunae]
MKKLVVAILAVLYLGVSSGATLHLHFCMGKLLGVSLVDNDSHKCGKCGMKKSAAPGKSCCKDEHKLVKLEKDHTASAFIELMQAPVVYQPVHQYHAGITAIAEQPVLFPSPHSPPLASEVPLFVRNCVFRI